MQSVNPSHRYAAVLFDGVCNFCNGWVRFIIERDPKQYFRFASLQSETASSLLRKHSIKVSLDSIVLLEGEKYYTESTAILRICKQLKGFWKGLYVLILVPKPIRDAVYRWFAKNRYRFFGRQESCMVPTPEIRERFLEIS